jgi:ABC-type Zn uptake system ZnuABC Zn-binding protein ZnuA
MWRRPFHLCLCFATVWAVAQPSPMRAQDRVQVVATTTDLRSLAEAVGGNLIEAVSLVPANFDAEEYQPKPQDVLRLKSARLVVRVGLDYASGSTACFRHPLPARSSAAGPAMSTPRSA